LRSVARKCGSKEAACKSGKRVRHEGRGGVERGKPEEKPQGAGQCRTPIGIA
jgi:hypothetical protein